MTDAIEASFSDRNFPEVTEADMVVSGAGATGWSFLLALEQHLSPGDSLSVVLIDTFDNSQPKSHPGFDARALALSQQSLQFFRKLKLDKAIASISTPIHHIHVSDQGGAGQVTLNHRDYGLNELGAVVEAQDLGKMLVERAQRQFFNDGVQNLKSKLKLTHIQPAQINNLITKRDAITVTVSTGQQIRSPLLVLAEGSYSATSKLLNIETRTQQYHQHAIITNVVTQKPHQNVAWERFTQSGPVAFLPMTQQRSGVVWSVDADKADAILAMQPEVFKAELQKAFGYRLGDIQKVGKTQSYPLHLITVDDAATHRTVCIGNAAQTLHPIAGQGFNLAFRDAWQLAQSIASRTDDIGSFRNLAAYKRGRQLDRKNTIFFTDTLVHLFSNKNPALQGARNLGLMAMQFIPAMKQEFARMAMGQKKVIQHKNRQDETPPENSAKETSI